MTNIITCALPYANGNLHIGHFFEAVSADIKSRYLKKQNINHYFISGDDCHGAATTLYCQKNNLNIEQHLNNQYLQHKESYNLLKINFDNFSKTNCELHHLVVHWCIENILEYEKENNIKLFEKREVSSWFDLKDSQFLPDRYVKGQCPHCLVLEQHPEICEQCNTVIEANVLINPINVLNSNEVVLKPSLHLTLNTNGFYDEILKHQHLFHDSIKGKILDINVLKKQYIDISRDGPYYGIKIKEFDLLENQFFYVWFDAPLGYLSFSYECWINDNNLNVNKDTFNTFLSESKFEHFIGKDIAYFHTFLWINLLKIINKKAKIEKIHFHGWLTQNDVKFSKSKGDKIDLSNLNAEQIDALRLYFFSKHDESIQDIDFSEGDVSEIYNQLIVKGLANFYARSIKIAEKNDITINFSETLNELYSKHLDEGNYKKLFIILNEDIKYINSEFQHLALWNESDISHIKSNLEKLLTKWFDIYNLLCLVCPEIKKHYEDINDGNFIHIAKPLSKFSLFNSD